MNSRRRRHGAIGRLLGVAMLVATAMDGHAICPAGNDRIVVAGPPPLSLAWRALQIDGSPISRDRLPMASHFVLDVELCAGADVSDAKLSKVDATMPEHRHGMNYRPRITPSGNGRFRVDGLMLHMAGRWRFEFEIDSGRDVRRLFHDVQIR